ncbi:MAG: insulinase family protein [Candidatus Vogelbacteria bacterium]|nr:insulinase family protein [Candidatus Vogelbacteria bacterium]
MKFKKKVLKNGLRIISVPNKDSLAATILVLVEAGSKYETKKINGLSHFLEHMCFKGTTNRPRAIDISGELDSLGAQYNAFTGHEYTGYYAKVEARHFDKALGIVADLYQNPLFNEKEIEKEKGVVIEEINMYEDLPQRKVQDLITELLYGDQPAGWSIAGDKETIKILNRQDFLKYRGEHYVASATTVVVAGKFDERNIVKKIESEFKAVVHGKKFGKIKTIDTQTKPAVMIRHKKSDQTHLVMAFRTCNTYDKRNYSLDLLAQVLGGGMSSRLFQRIREEMGAAYYVRAYNDTYTDHGYMAIAIGVDNSRVYDVISATIDELKKLKSIEVPAKELQMFKDSAIGGVVLALETSDAIANYFGGQEVLKKNIDGPVELAKKLRAVKAKDLMREAKIIFRDNNINLALIGPFESSEHFAKILHI